MPNSDPSDQVVIPPDGRSIVTITCPIDILYDDVDRLSPYASEILTSLQHRTRVEECAVGTDRRLVDSWGNTGSCGYKGGFYRAIGYATRLPGTQDTYRNVNLGISVEYHGSKLWRSARARAVERGLETTISDIGDVVATVIATIVARNNKDALAVAKRRIQKKYVLRTR